MVTRSKNSKAALKVVTTVDGGKAVVARKPRAKKAPAPKVEQPAPAPKASQRVIVEVASANRGQDSIAILGDKSTHLTTKMLGAGMKVGVGDNWDAKVKEYEDHISAEALRRNGQPKGVATLAKGAETEVHSRAAAAASRKGAVKTAPAKVTTATAKKPAPAKGAAVRKYKATKKADNSKPDSFRNYMISTIRAHKDTDAAKAAHKASGKHQKDSLNFNWAAVNGYIEFI